MANRVPTLLATAVAAACSLSAQASGPTQADYAKVVLYSNVTIAQDSASQWGIWEELEPPAAGTQTPLPLLAGAVDPYRPLGTVTPTTPVTPQPVVSACASGALCGFGVMALSTESWSNDTLQVAALSESESNQVRVGFQLFPQTTGTPGWLPDAISVSTQPVRPGMAETVPSFNILGQLVFDGTNDHRYETPLTSLPAGTPGLDERISIESDTASLPSDATAAKFQGYIQITSYVSGGPPDTRPQSGTTNEGIIYGVWGKTTSAQDMSNLLNGNAQASYSGNTFAADGSSTGNVKMTVNFGASTFVASFNNEIDSYGVRVETTASGGKQLQGPVGFRAEGAITGSTFQASKLSAQDGTVTGVVKGAFFGSQAAAAGGVVDITKSRVNTDPLPKYENARFSAPFVVTKDGINAQPK